MLHTGMRSVQAARLLTRQANGKCAMWCGFASALVFASVSPVMCESQSRNQARVCSCRWAPRCESNTDVSSVRCGWLMRCGVRGAFCISYAGAM